MRFGPLPCTLRQLQYAVAVADLASFRGAAERCLVSQPSLSAQVAELEGALGVRLFERDRRGVRVTAAGAELVERARRVLLDADELIEAARRHEDPLGGTLRIGVIPTVGPYLLPAAAPALHRALPKMTFEWTEEKTAVIARRVRAGELDAALLALVAEVAGLAHEAVVVDPFVLATPRGHRLARAQGPLRASELRGEPVLLLAEGHCLREQALAVCEGARAEELGFRATSLPTLVQMVAAGAGVTLLPSIAAPYEARHAKLALRRFARPEPSRTIVLAWRRGAALEPVLLQVAEVMRRAAAGAPAVTGRTGPTRAAR